jgi:LDH2 family malate/lactate/ureidoglycolate dehydrogenase
MDKAIREVRGVPRAPGVERIYLPGEREQLLADERGRSGIPIKQPVWVELLEVGNKLGVALKSDV